MTSGTGRKAPCDGAAGLRHDRPRLRGGAVANKIALLLVVAVLLVGAVLLTDALTKPEGRHGDTSWPIKTLISTLGHALELYNANVGHYPTEEEGGVKALVEMPSFSDPTMAANWHGPYIKADQLKDLWGSDIRYVVVPVEAVDREQVPFKLWSCGPDMIDGTEDDVRNWTEATTP